MPPSDSRLNRAWLVVPTVLGLALCNENTTLTEPDRVEFAGLSTEAYPHQDDCPDMTLQLRGDVDEMVQDILASDAPYADAAITVASCKKTTDGCELTIHTEEPIIVFRSDNRDGMEVIQMDNINSTEENPLANGRSVGWLFSQPELASCRVSLLSSEASLLVSSSPR